MGALALLYILVDYPLAHPPKLPFGLRWPLWSGSPFIFLGMNAILVYVIQEIPPVFFPISLFLFLPYTHWGAMANNLWGVLFWMAVAYDFYVFRIFLTV